MNNLSISIRSILKSKLNLAVTIVSLTVGFICVNLIGLFILQELNTDNFHKNKKQIYALSSIDPFKENIKMFYTRFGSAEYMKENFAQVEEICRVRKANLNKVIVNKNIFFDKPNTIAASSNFFEFFSYQLLSNNHKTVLESKDNIVISKELSEKYFGSVSPIGQIIEFENRDGSSRYMVSGIFKKPIENSQLNFDMVIKNGEEDSPCYLKLTKGTNPEEIEKLCSENISSIPTIFSIEGIDEHHYRLTHFQETYFTPPQYSEVEPKRDIADLWIAAIIGLTILIIGVFNYLGLVNNRLHGKFKEYTIRRMNGCSISKLVRYFMSENIIIISTSALLGFMVLPQIAPFFNTLVNAKITLSYLLQFNSICVLLCSYLMVILTTLVFISIKFGISLKTNNYTLTTHNDNQKTYVPIFNVFQLAASIILIVSSITIVKQIQYITNKPIGINKNVVQVKIPYQYKHVTPVFNHKLSALPEIELTTEASLSPVLQRAMVLIHYFNEGNETTYTPSVFEADHNITDVLDIKILEGKNFSKKASVNKNKIIINKALDNMFPDKDLLGKGLPGAEHNIIIGIANNFHYSELKYHIEPAYIAYKEHGDYLLVKPTVGKEEKAKTSIINIWNELLPNYPCEIETIGERYEWMHRENKNLVQLVSACCIISIFLSMIGLFAISVQTCHKRIKEIGIRKVNGATINEIVQLINTDFFKWLAFAFIAAGPVAFWVMQKWLERFSYKTHLNWWLFALAGLLLLAIALITISWQSFIAAKRNPVESLRYE